MKKTWDKFWNRVINMNKMTMGILCILAIVISLFIGKICFLTPYPLGIFLNQGGNYQVNTKGIVYTSSPVVPFAYPFTGNATWGYLKGADIKSFEVIDHQWAKDKNHVWYEYTPVKGVDVATFELGKSGIPKDKYHVFVQDDLGFYRPTQCGINPATSEYFVMANRPYWDKSWMRDSQYVYFEGRRMDVDRATFRKLTGTGENISRDAEWYVDKDFIYAIRYYDFVEDDPQTYDMPTLLVRVDTLHKPLEMIPRFVKGIIDNGTHCYSSEYLHNGRNIIFQNKVVMRDIDVKSIRVVSDADILNPGICIINDTLRLQYGERIGAKKPKVQIPQLAQLAGTRWLFCMGDSSRVKCVWSFSDRALTTTTEFKSINKSHTFTYDYYLSASKTEVFSANLVGKSTTGNYIILQKKDGIECMKIETFTNDTLKVFLEASGEKDRTGNSNATFILKRIR